MTVSLILASSSPSRRAVLSAAGVIPIVHSSHVDEPYALAQAARDCGVSVEVLSAQQRVMILAQAKARAVYQEWLTVRSTAASAQGICEIAYPLQAEGVQADTVKTDEQDDLTHSVQNAQTRDFSGIDMPIQRYEISRVGVQSSDSVSSAEGVLIVGCDSMFLLDGVCYGKPHSVEVAQERIAHMSGRTGQLWTGHCLIDARTGRMCCEASCANVSFAQLTEEEIGAYVATGEPLEVAGSFTLEGFGGAFIERVEGDPHGVLGISLPLLRSMVAQFGYSWPQLWNKPITQEQQGSPESSIVPKENVHQPGDGWVQCDCGRQHWGHNGASGVLLARRDDDGNITHIVLQHRALWSAEGGTWGIPGGATSDGESAIEGALRESYEEANITSQDIDVVGAYREDHGNWAYTTVFAFEKPGHVVMPCARDNESMQIAWVPVDEVCQLKLLTAFRTDWPIFRQRLEALSTLRVD